MLVLNAHTLTKFQTCERDYGIGLTHRLQQWTPHGLLSACLRKAIFSISNGQAVDNVADITVNYFLSCARSPGLELPTGINTYTLIMDYIAIIRNVLEYLSRCTLLCLKEIANTKISDDVEWQYLSHMDESGVLHRWSFIDYIPQDIIGELHGWDVFGDIAASGYPMTLHLVAIGKRQGNHQASPWCRVYSHPRVHNVYRFNRKSGEDLQGDWKPVYFSENSKNNSSDWIDWMQNDNAVDELMQHIRVKEVPVVQRASFRDQVLIEAARAQHVTPGMDLRKLPMRRKACDSPTICRHQDFCYGQLPLDSIAKYEKLPKKNKVELQGVVV